MSDRTQFTVVFAGDLRGIVANPLQIETPFGIPQTVGFGDAFAERDALEEELNEWRGIAPRTKALLGGFGCGFAAGAGLVLFLMGQGA